MSNVALNQSILDEENLLSAEMDGKYLTFALGEEQYGISIRDVTEIIGIQHITGMPDVDDYVKGVINLRGKVIPVIDMRLRFELEEADYDERTCIVVVNVQDSSVGLIVDTVSEVQAIEDGNIDPPPSVFSNQAKEYIEGLGRVDDQVKILLNTRKILFDINYETATKSEVELAEV